jgi:hypothetical protein
VNIPMTKLECGLTPTTEGVWLSVTPTKDYLVVALDFEGLLSTDQ